MATSAFTQGFRERRAATQTRRPRTPILLRAGRLAARVLPTWAGFRAFVLHLAGLGCLTAAAWIYALWAGLVAAGISLLILEALTGSDR